MGLLRRRNRPVDPQERVRQAKAAQAADEAERRERLGLGKVEITGPYDYGTPETRAKNRTDIVRKLAANGSLNKLQVEAAREILSIIEAKNSDWQTGRNTLDGVRVDYSNSPPEPLTLLSGEIGLAYELRYLPWLAEVSADYIVGKHSRIGVPLLVYEVVCANNGPSQLDKRWRFKNGTTTKELSRALHRYVLIAGWTLG